MTYYNFHAIAKNLILTNHCISATWFENYHHIRPALVLYFDNHRPIPIREYRWEEYLPLLKQHNIPTNKL
ncbi:MAG: thermostable hemolysin delta-VPH [Clostridia bacterium]|nr:thermostable hemolysin delta-VPH [Clostridia bacterium]